MPRAMHNRKPRTNVRSLRDELAFSWRAAQREAVAAYRAWATCPGEAAYAAYRAAQDRADRAQDDLAAARSR